MPDDVTPAAALRLADVLDAEQLDALNVLATKRGVPLGQQVAEILIPYTQRPTTRAAERESMAPVIPPAALDRLPRWQRAVVLAAGETVRRWYRLRSGGRYRLGPGLIANQRLRLCGPGRITLGRDVNAWGRAEANRLDAKTADATIRVGDRVRLNGAGLQAVAGISIGDDCILGSCTIVDTDYHGVDPASRDRPVTLPIVIGNNVWIGGSVILKGVNVGDNSVIGLGSVVTDDVPSDVLVAGNPARVVRPLIG